MTSPAVRSILHELGRAGIEVWLDGGWGVDALLGRQTRPHAGLDIIVRVADLRKLHPRRSVCSAFESAQPRPPGVRARLGERPPVVA
jgi:aminoglycoside-2''-adenylyltransferase